MSVIVQPFAAIARVYGLRHMLWQLVRRDIAGRYRGSFGGAAWSVITPVLLLAVYVFVFGFVFNPRGTTGPRGADIIGFGLSLFCGVLVHGMFAECLVRAPAVVVGQPSYVKKIVFPLELLPLVTVGSALFHLVVALVVLVVGVSLFAGLPGLTALMVPVALAPLVLMCAGVAWLIASLGVFLRDIGQLTGLAATVLMFLSPVFYPVEALPADWRWLASASPLTVPIEALRDALLRGRMPDLGALAAYSAVSIAVCWAGWTWFARTRKGFADVL